MRRGLAGQSRKAANGEVSKIFCRGFRREPCELKVLEDCAIGCKRMFSMRMHYLPVIPTDEVCAGELEGSVHAGRGVSAESWGRVGESGRF